MKMRKVISLISSFAIIASVVASVATVSYAAETTPASIEAKVSVDGYGYYCVDYVFSLEETAFNIALAGSDREGDFYSGTGLMGLDFAVEDLPATADGSRPVLSTSNHILATGRQENDFKNTQTTRYAYANSISFVEELVASGSNEITLVSLSTNYKSSEKTAAEIKNAFSNFSKVKIKTVTATNVYAGSNVSETCVTYGIVAGGVKDTDANYGITIKNDEAGGGETTTTATVVGDYTGDKTAAGNDDESDKATAIVGTPAAPESRATSLVWTVTPNTGDAQQFTQVVDVEGGATYKFGLVLRNITADLIKTVSAVLQ